MDVVSFVGNRPLPGGGRRRKGRSTRTCTSSGSLVAVVPDARLVSTDRTRSIVACILFLACLVPRMASVSLNTQGLLHLPPVCVFLSPLPSPNFKFARALSRLALDSELCNRRAALG
jgi:hypothetical protein